MQMTMAQLKQAVSPTILPLALPKGKQISLPAAVSPIAIPLSVGQDYCRQCGDIHYPLKAMKSAEWYCEFDQAECHSCGTVRANHEICQECDTCSECCTCPRCGRCETVAHDSCTFCGRCENCCQCDFCDNCHSLSDTCDCVYCGSCDSYNSDRCSTCRYCDNCCTCSGAVIPGWRVRKELLPRDLGADNYRQTAIMARSIDPVERMATFYLLDYITAIAPGNSAVAVFQDEARAMQAELVANLAPVFADYVAGAIGGELRHHRNTYLPDDRPHAWDYWAGMVATIGVPALAQDAAELFLDGSWEHHYGGEPWANAARVWGRYGRGEIGARNFVDNLFSLQHNSGSLLDKLDWKSNPWGWTVEHMVLIGNAHAARDTDLRLMLAHANGDARTLFAEWWTAKNRANRDNCLPLEIRPVAHSRKSWDRANYSADWNY